MDVASVFIRKPTQPSKLKLKHSDPAELKSKTRQVSQPLSRKMEPEAIIANPEPLHDQRVKVPDIERGIDEQGNETAPREPYLVRFQFPHLFSTIFRVHNRKEVDAILLGDTQDILKSPDEIEWPQTWLYSRIFLWMLLLTVVMFFMKNNLYCLPGIILLGTFSMPIVMVTYFLEMNVSREVNVIKAGSVFLLGGVFSIFFNTLITPFFSGWEELLKASVAGLTEEPAKMLILLFFVGNNKRYPHILNGILLGASIGAGFAAFESAGYAFGAFFDMLSSATPQWSFEHMAHVIFIRGYTTPFMHTVWTAAVGGALWTVRANNSFNMSMLFDKRVLGTFFFSVVLHMLWNSGWLSLKSLGLLAWIVVFYYLRLGLQQLADEQVSFSQEGI
jgi:RsiW-degrading membrane proteinase PrsW (M82 family)